MSVTDLQARTEALDAGRSFIVQAPAGSGKTELLIQRYLVLLSHVAQPEEIAAITFTKKASAEMRKRVLEALASARSGVPPEAPHQALTWAHARAALARDRALGWRLEENAARLRIQTIDALCASLTRQMPVLAAFGGQPEPLEDASQLYREAARATLTLLEEEGDAGDLVAKLLVHLDNDLQTAEELIAGTLERRDQWMRAIVRGLDRARLEAALAAECRAGIERARKFFPGNFKLPPDADLEAWRRLAGELLTTGKEWRKSGRTLLLERTEPFREAVLALGRLPLPNYTDEQWEALDAIARMLPIAVAQLKVVFAAHGQADFTEISQGASGALGPPDAPTDLLLSLDYRIRHLLVDEFQDTSLTQFELLEKLTSGWQPGDGRTLFLVGDPMQSIYRFREAEVGLFLRARRAGLGTVRLEPLTLSVNFRSQAGIVAWVNSAFEKIMPRSEDIAAGAVPYVRCEPRNPAQAGAVQVHAFFDGDEGAEAERVAALVEGAQADGTVAVLVRSRGHLEKIMPRLKQRAVRFRAIEIEHLGRRQVVQDLLALTRALAHPADRLAWLAVLRAPWCGLTLADLHALAGADEPPAPASASARGAKRSAAPGQGDLFSNEAPAAVAAGASPTSLPATLWETLGEEASLARLSADGRSRAARTRAALARAMANRLRDSLRARVEATWLALGGPACVEDETDLEDAETYLDYLEKAEEAGELPDPVAFEAGLDKLYALPDLRAESDAPQVLTVHKAKGLEFDTVIVAGLGSGSARDERKLFVWMERAGEADGSSSLLLAPINPSGGDEEPTYEYVRRLDREKEGHEEGRLLYVAATRAKKRLHLVGGTRLGSGSAGPELKRPGRGVLLAKLWPAVESDFADAVRALLQTPRPGAAREAPQPVDQDLRRLVSGWAPPEAPPAVRWSAPVQEVRLRDDIEFSWAGETARRVGVVVHRWLQRIAEESLSGWDRARVESMREGFRRELAVHGVQESELAESASRVAAALAASLEDPKGRWLLGPQRESRNEYRLTAVVDGERRSLIIDRTFVDPEGRRWIADYKTSSHEGKDLEGFLDRERERYRGQLERYARALAADEDSMLGLYFPLLAGWRQWRL